MKVTFADPSMPKSGILAVGILSDNTLTPAAKAIDEATDGAISRALDGIGRFTGKAEEIMILPAPSGIAAQAIVLFGLGDLQGLDELRLQRVGGVLMAQCLGTRAKEATIRFDLPDDADIASPDAAAELAYGALLRSYRFDAYKTVKREEDGPTLKQVTVMTPRKAVARKIFADRQKVADGVFLTRDLVSEPANRLYPENFAERCRPLGKLGLTVEILDEKKMSSLGMGSLLSVSQGSEREARVVVMQWKGGKAKEAPVAFIGKGVTFDTGGISLKPAAGMEDMKWDMGGAGVVTGLMAALAGRKAKVNAVGIIGLVENMPSGSATRPGDIVTSMSGQTIEVINTDAEGRMVLADLLWYVQDRFKPRSMVDLATLTGAIIVALGEEQAGVFSNDDDLAEQLRAAGKATGEGVWRLPMGDYYDRQIDSDAADMKNVGSGRAGGSSVAAQFLQRFIKDVPWAHLDIAGVTWNKKDRPTVPKGGSGYGVRLLDRLVADTYERS